MNLKTKITIISLFLSLSVFSQKDCFDQTFWKECENQNAELDFVTFNNSKIYFYFVEKIYASENANNVCTFRGTVIMPDLKIKLNRKEKQRVFQLINDKINLVSFVVYSTCEAFQLSRTAIWHKKKEKHLNEHLIGTFTTK